MANAYDRLKDAVIARIDEQIKATREESEQVTPVSSGADTSDRVAMQTMYRNAFIKAMKLSAGIVLEEHKRLNDPKPAETERPIRHAPYSTRHRGQDPQKQQ